MPVAAANHRRAQDIIERAQRTIKECVRSVVITLEFALPTSLAPQVVDLYVSRLNLLPDSSSDNHVSPQERFSGRKPSFNRDLGFRFGQLLPSPSIPSSY